MTKPLWRAALLTPRGRGAIATIRICGDIDKLAPEEFPFRPANGRPLSEQSSGRILFGRWGDEDVVCCRCNASTFEIHCHGGRAAVERLLDDLRNLGVKIVAWQELIATTADTLEAELHDALSRTVTWRSTEYLLHQLDGRLRSELESLNCIAWITADKVAARNRLDELLRCSKFGRHLTEPWRVVIAGPANVGKSSLMNALLGFKRSIVFDQPGTTRDVLTANTAFDGWPVELIDTAGLRETDETLEAAGIARAISSTADADLVLRVIDINGEPQDVKSGSDEILVAQKCDLPDHWGDRLPACCIKVSARTGAGLETLQQEIARRLVPETPRPEIPLPISPQQIRLLETMRNALQNDDERSYFAASGRLVNDPSAADG